MKRNRGSYWVLMLLFMKLFAGAADENGTVMLTGKYRLDCDTLPRSVLPFSQLDFSCCLSGEGEAPKVTALFPEKEGLAMRVRKEKRDNGTFHECIFHYTLLTGEKTVVLPRIALKAYDPVAKHFYRLQVPPRKVNIEAVQPKEILDAEDSLPKEVDLAPYLRYLYGILVFTAGFVSAMLLPRLRKYLRLKSQKADNA